MTAHKDILPDMIRPDSITTKIIERIADRYDVLSILGAGAFGSVYKGYDTISKQEVALKFFRAFGKKDLDRFRRETATLRLLRLPGVVEVLDDGVNSNGMPWVAMELVVGKPFPGDARKHAWHEIAEVTHGLLEALARVHHAGVLHLDLKPDNILVDSAGRVTLLDFGISNSPRHRKVTEIAGTPAYIAPERVMRRKMDERADIFAIGVMLFEALTGELPFDADTLTTVMSTRTAQDAASILGYDTDAPRHVLEAIDAMLSTSPRERPRYLEEVMELLGQPTVTSPDFRLGPSSYLDDLLAAVDAGTAEITVGGSPGSGRTRLLADLGVELVARGKHTPSDWPPKPDTDVCLIDEGVDAPLEERRAALARGVTLVRALSTPGADIELEPFSKEDLAEAFHGPELVLALKSRSAAELHRRTGGVPAAAMAELAAWVRSGICFWDAGRVRIDRLALDRLGLTNNSLATITGDGPKHERGRITIAPPRPSSDKTIDSALVAHETETTGTRSGAAEALRQTWAALEEGLPCLAFTAAEWAMRLAAASNADSLRREALYARVSAALLLSQTAPVEVAMYEVAQSGPWCPESAELGELCRLHLSGLDPAVSIGIGQLPTEWLEHQRHALLAKQLVYSHGANAEAGQRLVEWAAGNERRRRQLAIWIGVLRYQQLSFEESLRWQLYAAETPNKLDFLQALQNASVNAIELGQYELASEMLDSVLEAASHVFPLLGMKAVIEHMQINYRRGVDDWAPWDATLELVDLIAAHSDKAKAYLSAAATAWRLGNNAAAADLATTAASSWEAFGHQPSGTVLARALAAACGRPDSDLGALIRDAKAESLPGIKLQCLALLTLAAADLGDVDDLVKAAITDLGSESARGRREVLSVTECRDLLLGARQPPFVGVR